MPRTPPRPHASKVIPAKQLPIKKLPDRQAESDDERSNISNDGDGSDPYHFNNKVFIADVRAGLTNKQLAEKYGLSVSKVQTCKVFRGQIDKLAAHPPDHVFTEEQGKVYNLTVRNDVRSGMGCAMLGKKHGSYSQNCSHWRAVILRADMERDWQQASTSHTKQTATPPRPSKSSSTHTSAAAKRSGKIKQTKAQAAAEASQEESNFEAFLAHVLLNDMVAAMPDALRRLNVDPSDPEDLVIVFSDDDDEEAVVPFPTQFVVLPLPPKADDIADPEQQRIATTDEIMAMMETSQFAEGWSL